MTVIPHFGKVLLDFGAIGALGAELAELGLKRPLLVTEPALAALGFVEKAEAALTGGQELSVFTDMPSQPTAAAAEAIAKAFTDNDCDAVVPMGGGIVIDSCKAAAILTGNPPPLRQYSGQPEKITGPVPPIIAIPTTAGTGSEVSRGAGIHPEKGQREFSAGGPMVLPRVAICDPELTLSLPRHITAGTGMDALGHCIEGFLSTTVNPVADAIALDGIGRVFSYIERAVEDGGDREARWNMMLAATQGGMAISKGLGCAHALSMTFSDTELHHGALVTISMPVVLRFLEGHVGDKMDRLAEAMGLPQGANAATAVADLNERVGLPNSIRELGYQRNDLDELAAFAAPNHFNRTSPRKPNEAEYKEILAELLS